MDIERIRHNPKAQQPDQLPGRIESPSRSRKPTSPLKPNSSSILDGRLRWQLSDKVGFHSGSTPRRRGYVLAIWSWLASFIDVLILVSLSSVFLMIVGLVFKQSPNLVIAHGQNNPSLASLFVEVFMLMAWIYLVAMRAFMGATIGEWSCDIRLGSDKDTLQRNYLLKVAARESLMILTGLVLLPILSLVLARDLVGNLLGLKLHSLK